MSDDQSREPSVRTPAAGTSLTRPQPNDAGRASRLDDSQWSAMRQQTIERLQRWIHFDSVSSRSNDPINRDIAEELTSLGFDVELQPVSDRDGVVKTNVVAECLPTGGDSRHEGRLAGGGSADGGLVDGGLAYFCHTDVVPADDWTGPGGPFDSAVADQRVYGRGACDMKGSLAAMMQAVSLIDPAQLTRPLRIICTADEEVGFAGAKQFRSHPHFDAIRRGNAVAIFGEPTGMRPIHAHKGGQRWQFTADGVAGHSGTRLGVNANEAIAAVFHELADLADTVRHDERFLNHDFDPPHLCINFGIENPSSAVNITPAWARIWVFLRPMPGVDHDAAMQRVVTVAERHGVKAERQGLGDAYFVDPESPHIRWLSEFVGEASGTVGYGTDASQWTDLTRGVVIGPGDIAQAHTSDEYISVEQLRRGVEVYAAMIRRFAIDGV